MNEQEQEAVDVVAELIAKLSKPTMVFRFAHASLNRPGAEKRMVNAAKEYMRIIEECDYFT